MPVVLAGDYNVVPTPFDIYETKSYAKNALVQPESRAAFQALLDKGWVDAIRALHPGEPIYTFWDYMRNRWQRDAGLRLDHFLLSSEAAGRLTEAGVDRAVRGEENASDHAPAWIVLADTAGRRRAPSSPKRPPATRPVKARPARTRAKSSPDPRVRFSSSTAISSLIVPIMRCRRRSSARTAAAAGAILGFANMLLRLYREEQPRAVLVAWDTLEKPTYRQKLFPPYQSGRKFDEALLQQLRRSCRNSSPPADFRKCKGCGLRGGRFSRGCRYGGGEAAWQGAHRERRSRHLSACL